MSFLRRMLGGGATHAESPDEDAPVPDDRQAVSVWLRLDDPGFENEREQARVFAVENRLIAALEESGVGAYDTNDLLPGFFSMRVLGPDADQIVALLTPLLGEAGPGSYLAVRRGPSGTQEERVDLASSAE
jgi:hypothetical protein